MSQAACKHPHPRGAGRTPALALLLVLILAAGCGEAGTGTAEIPRWELVEVSRFGDPAGDDALLLSRLRDLVRTDEALYVADGLPGGTGRVLAIDHEGEPIGEIGRVGEGPAEYRAPSGLQLLGDTLWMVDQSRALIIGFVDGEAVRSFSIPLRDGPARAVPRGMTAEGHALVGYTRGIPEIVAGLATATPIVRMDRRGTVVDTLLDVPYAPEDFWESEAGLGRTPLQQTPLTMLLGDGSAVIEVSREPWRDGNEAAYSVRVVPLDGGASYSIDVPYDPEPTDVEGILELLPDEAPAPSVEAIRARLLEIPYRPPVLAVATSERASDGVWIRRDDPRPTAAPWDVISLERRERIATVWAPPILQILRVTDGEVWGAMRSNLDVPLLVRYVLDKNPDDDTTATDREGAP